jgi:hypothetical protein
VSRLPVNSRRTKQVRTFTLTESKKTVDPNATFRAFLVAIGESDVLGAHDAADCLATWLGNGGFEPVWLPEERDAFLMFIANVPRPDYAN